MEYNARYALAGLFTIAAVAAMFGFVYWLNNTGGLGERAAYQVRFSVPVSGLTIGSGVLFNGIKVGEVDRIHIDPERPEQLIAVISVIKDTPVRTDTAAGVDYQGLTGAANILLSGGTAGAARLASGDGSIPVIVADPAESRSWTQNAGRVLARIDDLLGRNSGRFDAILSGLERMTGGGAAKEQAAIYDPPPPDSFPPPEAERDWQLVVAEPSVMLSLNTDRVQQQVGEASARQLADARWADNLPNFFQTKIVQSFENAGYAEVVLRPADAVDPDYRLIIDIRAFHFATHASPTASIDFVAKIVERGGKVVAAKRFQAELPVEATGEAPAVAALGNVFSTAIVELVNWTVATLKQSSQVQSEGATE